MDASIDASHRRSARTWSTETTLPTWLNQYDSGRRILTCENRDIRANDQYAMPPLNRKCLSPTMAPLFGPTSAFLAAAGAGVSALTTTLTRLAAKRE